MKYPPVKQLGTATTIGQLRKMIAEYPDDMSFGFRNQPMQELQEITYDDQTCVCFTMVEKQAQEQKPQFQISLYSDQLIISTECNRRDAYCAPYNVKHEIKIGDHDWIEEKGYPSSYHDCCAVMRIFGIDPPTYDELSYLFVKKDYNGKILE